MITDEKARKLIVLTFFFIWVLLQLFLSSRVFSFNYDEGVYLQTSLQYAKGQQLYREVFLDQPPLFAESLRLLINAFGNSVLAARSYVILFGLAILIATLLIAKEFFGARVAFLSVLIAGINFYLFSDAHTIHGNTPSLAFALFSIYTALRYNKTKKFANVPFSALFFALANGFKLLEMFFLFPIAFLLTVGIRPEAAGRTIPDRSISYRRFPVFRSGEILKSYGTFALAFFAVFIPILACYHLPTIIRHIFLMGAEGAFRITRNVQMFFIAYVGYQPGLAAGIIAGLVNLWILRRKVFAFFLVWVLTQLLFHALMSKWLWHHHLIALFPAFSIIVAAGIDSFIRSFEEGRGILFTRLNRSIRLLRAILVTTFVFIALPNFIGNVYVYIKQAVMMDSPPVKALMESMKLNSTADDLIVSDEQMALFRSGRLTYPDLVETSRRRIKTGNLKEARLLELGDAPKMVIFWTRRLKSFQNYYGFVQKRYTLIYEDKGKEIYSRP